MIKLIYGNRQQFRLRHEDINILGFSDSESRVICALYSLNEGPYTHFYVEPNSMHYKKKYPYGTRTPSVHRLRGRQGHFNIEIPIDSPQLKEGWNKVSIQIEYIDQESDVLNAEFRWNPDPLSLPIDLKDLSRYQNIQEIGQIVNGAFDIDYERNVIRSRAPVGADILFLLGSPAGSQEATYNVKFTHTQENWCFMGLSDFFFGHEEQSPELGIKPGYSTAGLATIDQRGRAQIWLAWGDCLIDNNNAWVVKTEKRIKVSTESELTYSVRHQTIIEDGVNISRFRIWPKDNMEPESWLCVENNLHLDPGLPRLTKASFGIFQYWGSPTEWSDIRIQQLDVDMQSLKLKRRKNNIITRQWGRVQELTKRYFRSSMRINDEFFI